MREIVTVASPDLVIVDPCIRRLAGHYAAYAAACRDGLEADGVSTVCWSHRDVETDVASALHARPVFTHDCWHQFNTIPKLRFVVDPPLAVRSFLHDARVASRGTPGDPVYFAPTVDHRQLLAWAWWLRRKDAPRRAVLMLRYSFANPSGPGWVRSAAWVRHALRMLRRTSNVRFATDSARLGEEYRELGAQQVAVLPIPHTTAVRNDTPRLPGRLRIVSLGDARTEKGFAVLGDAIARLRAASRLPEAEFIVQANIQSPAYAHLEDARSRLRGVPGVTLIERALSGGEYEELLRSADLVVLPYDQGVYRSRTSGPFAEALAAGIPVVCTADTWMSDQLSTYGAGEQCRSGDADSLAQALERAAARLPALTERAVRGRAAWVAFHAPSRFSQMLRELVA